MLIGCYLSLHFHLPPVQLHEACGGGGQGLALPSLSKASAGRPAFWHMVDLGLLDAATFSLWLNPDVSDVAAGEVRFGGSDESRHLGALVELPVISNKCALATV